MVTNSTQIPICGSLYNKPIMSDSKSLQTLFREEEKLSKEQELFQKRTESIARLRHEISELTVSLRKAHEVFIKTKSPFDKEYDDLVRERLKVLADVYLTEKKIPRGLKFDLLDVIQNETRNIISRSTEPELEIKELFLKCSGQTYEDYLKEQERLEEEMESEMFEAIFGFSKEEVASEEEFFERVNRGRDNFNNQETKQEQKRKEKQKKKAEQKQLLEQKSIKEIFRQLIKAFHPDKELDEVRKVQKTEVSKKITEAYKKGDLFTLLTYELELLQENKDRLKELAKEKLKLYNEILVKQKTDLEGKLYRLKHENELLYRAMCTKQAKPEKFIRQMKGELRERNEGMKDLNFLLDKDFKFVKLFVRQYLEELEGDSNFIS